MSGITTVHGRTCGTCTMCCKVMGIDELRKPDGVWCPHCKPGRGCGIYADRPPSCRGFYCGYLLQEDVGEEWRPSVSKMVLVAEPKYNRITAFVDPQRPEAWRAEPYIGQLRRWAAGAATVDGQVQVCVRTHTYAILPDRIVDLGVVAPGEFVFTTKRITDFGVILNAEKVPGNDPRLGALGFRVAAPASRMGGPPPI